MAEKFCYSVLSKLSILVKKTQILEYEILYASRAIGTKKSSYFGTETRNKFRMVAEKEKSGERAPLVYQRAVT